MELHTIIAHIAEQRWRKHDMKRIIDIPDEYYKAITGIPNYQCTVDMLIIKYSIPCETVTEFADRCKECGAKYGKLLKQVPCDDCVSRK